MKQSAIRSKPTVRFTATLKGLHIALLAKAKAAQGESIEAVVNGLPFRSAAKKHASIGKKLQKALRLNDGDAVAVEIVKIGDEAEARVPTDLGKAISATPKARATWEATTPLARREWVFWLITTKQEDTRKKRIAKALDMLSHGKRRVCCWGGADWLMRQYGSN